MLVTRETPERYRPRACEYIEMALVEVPIYLAATTEPLLQNHPGPRVRMAACPTNPVSTFAGQAVLQFVG